MLLTAPKMPGPKLLRTAVQPVRLGLGRSFTRRYRGPELDARIADAADLKTLDANMAPDEIDASRRLAVRKRRHASDSGQPRGSKVEPHRRQVGAEATDRGRVGAPTEASSRACGSSSSTIDARAGRQCRPSRTRTSGFAARLLT